MDHQVAIKQKQESITERITVTITTMQTGKHLLVIGIKRDGGNLEVQSQYKPEKITDLI